MLCPRCSRPFDNEAAFCGNCGYQLAPLRAPGATVGGPTELVSAEGQSNDQMSNAPSLHAYTHNDRFYQNTVHSNPMLDPVVHSRPPLRPVRSNVRGRTFIAILLTLVVIGVSAGLITFFHQGNGFSSIGAQPANAGTGSTSGTVSFLSGPGDVGVTDTILISANGLATPPKGMQYDAWMVNQQTEQSSQLGPLKLQGQQYALKAVHNGHNFLGDGDQIVITQEQGLPNLPTGKPVLSAQFPPMAFVHIKHLLFQFTNTPHLIGLLPGLLGQAQVLDAQANQIKGAFTAHNPAAVQCAAQGLINIVEGNNGPHTQQLNPVCQAFNVTSHGDGYGLLGDHGYVSNARAHTSLASTQPDTTPTIRLHAGHVMIALTNIQGWLTTIDQDAQNLLQNSNDKQSEREIVSLSANVLNGIDLNNDESVDPVPGEAGAITAMHHGQLMASLTLVPGK